MKKKLAAIAAIAVIFTVSAVSCGTVESTDDSVVLSVETGTKASTEAGEGAAETSTETTASTKKDKKETTTKADSEESTTEAPDEETTTKSEEQETTQPQEQNGNTDNNNNNNNNNQQPEQPVQNTEQPQPVNTEPPAQQEQPRNDTVTFNMDTLLSDASGILSKLGTPSYSGISPACTNNGSDIKEYEFTNIKVQCYFEGSVEKICHIEITGGDYATDKGIKVGSSRADVEAAYGTGQEFGNMMIYASGDKEMDISYNGDTVSSIEFNAVV